MKKKLSFLLSLLMIGFLYTAQLLIAATKPFNDKKTPLSALNSGNNNSCFVYDQNNKHYTVNNVSNKLIARITNNAYTLQPSAGKGTWSVQLQLSTIGKINQQFSLKNEAKYAIFADKLEAKYPEYTIEYINNNSGIRQNFIINQPIKGSEPLVVKLTLVTNLKPLLKGTNSILFVEENPKTGDLKNIVWYKDLLAYDANGKVLASEMKLADNEIHLIVNDDEAVYPITIDPLSTTADWDLDNSALIFAHKLGKQVAPAGDVNNDGYADVLVVADGNADSSYATAYLFLGGQDGLNYTPTLTYTDTNNTSTIIAKGIGDVNGDEFSDFAICVPNYDSGAVFVYYGNIAASFNSPDYLITGKMLGIDLYNCAIAGAGDVNGDGYSDFMLGLPELFFNNDNNKGKVYIFYGNNAGLSTTPSFIINGGSAIFYTNFGGSISCAGDINGDGYSDIIIADKNYNDGKGKIWTYYGSAASIDTNNIWQFAIGGGAYHLGSAVAGAGDIDGDGYSDILVGAGDFSISNNEGITYIFYGTNNGIDTIAKPYHYLIGPNTNQYFGKWLAGLGDVNGDGYFDIAIGSNKPNSSSTGAGSVWVYYGKPEGIGNDSNNFSHIINGQMDWDFFGTALSAAGDVNGDGFADILVGAYNNGIEGRACAFYGGAETLGSLPNWSKNGNSASSFGHCVRSAGDVNADGFDDIIIGAPEENMGYGEFYVYLGNDSGVNTFASFSALGTQYNEKLGFSVGTAGDIDNDGFSDIIVGAPSENGMVAPSKAMIYAGGGILNSEPIWRCSMDNTTRFGYAVATAGDVNGDGYPDIIVGAPYFTDNFINQGCVYIFYGGPTMDTIPDWTFKGTNNEELFGIAVATAGDVNGDGFSDIIVGSRMISNNSGKATVFYGSATGLSPTINWQITGNANDELGHSVASAGDVNGDGFADVIIGAPNKNFGQGGEGEVYLYLGKSNGLDTLFSWINQGTTMYGNFGYAVASAGDVNSDGYSDIIIGHPGINSGYGASYLYYGSSTGITENNYWTFTDESANNTGKSVASAGDVNGDGYSDIIVGGPLSNCIAYVFNGIHNPSRQAITASFTPTNIPLAPGNVLNSNLLRVKHQTYAIRKQKIKMRYKFYSSQDNYQAPFLNYYTTYQTADTGNYVFDVNFDLNPYEGIGIKYKVRTEYHKAGMPDLPLVSRWQYPNRTLSDLGNAFLRYNNCQPPTITAFNTDTIIKCQGDSLELSISVNGIGPFTYLWFRNSDTLSFTQDSIKITNLTMADSGNYYCKISNACGSVTSPPVVIKIIAKPNVVSNYFVPGSTVCAGDSIHFIVVANGESPLQYQWYGPNGIISGAVNSSFQINNVNITDTGNYYCVVTNFCGIDTSDLFYFWVNTPPTIIQQSGNDTVCQGATVVLKIVANSNLLLDYQWYKNGMPLAGSADSLVLTNVSIADAADYYCEVSNSCGSVASSVIHVEVNYPPLFYQHPVSVTVCEGGTTELTALVNASMPFTYQWYKDGIILPFATPSLLLSNVSNSDMGWYYAIVVNMCGSSTSDSAFVNVKENLTASFIYSINGNTVTFTNTSSPFKYCLWNFGNGQVSNDINPIITYPLPGVYHVCLTIYNDTSTCGIADIYCAEIVVQPGLFSCNANFTYQRISNNVIAFNSSASTGNNLQYFWSFGDAQNSYSANPVHTYPNNGYYTVTLTVRNQTDSCIDSETQLIYVGDTNNITACKAQFTYYNSIANTTVNFFDQSLGNNLKYYLWNFGDNTISTAKNPVHTYTMAGYYSVCLTITDSLGNCVNMNCQTINVGNNTNALLMFFNYLPDTTGGKAVGNVEFKGAAWGDPSRVIWTFGDSTIDSNVFNISHTYQNPGYYLVSFQGNNQQVENASYQLVNVAAPVNSLQCKFGYKQAATNKKGVGSVEFKGAAWGDPSRCSWTFGDGEGDTTTLFPNHTYDTAGLYYVCLTVFNANTQQSHTHCEWVQVADTNVNIMEKQIVAGNSLKVFPNPAQEKVYMQFIASQPDMPYSVVISDLTGRIVHQLSGTTTSTGLQLIEWNCKSISAGSYIIHYSSPILKTNQKLLITK